MIVHDTNGREIRLGAILDQGRVIAIDTDQGLPGEDYVGDLTVVGKDGPWNRRESYPIFSRNGGPAICWDVVLLVKEASGQTAPLDTLLGPYDEGDRNIDDEEER